jgi:DNA-directed RNA polymerase subunit RPC12/RpoP
LREAERFLIFGEEAKETLKCLICGKENERNFPNNEAETNLGALLATHICIKCGSPIF